MGCAVDMVWVYAFVYQVLRGLWWSEVKRFPGFIRPGEGWEHRSARERNWGPPCLPGCQYPYPYHKDSQAAPIIYGF